MAGQVDSFGIPMWHPTKSGGFEYFSSDDPTNDKAFEGGSETSNSGTNEVTMKPSGPTNFHLGKNVAGFKDETGGCGKHFPDWKSAGYAWKKDDVRDMEIKGVFKFNIGSNGFSISVCTGHHASPGPCCQGHAYMITVEPSDSPYTAEFRKEMWHVSYHPAPGGNFDIPGISGDNKWVGLGFVRYNKPGAEDTSVILEFWANVHPDSDIADWKMIKKIEDKPGNGWGDDGDDCDGDKDQVLTWSGPKNRFKTNAGSGTVKAKMLSLREIDPTGSGGGGTGGGDGDGGGGGGVVIPPEPIPAPTTGTLARDWIIRYNIGVFEQNSCGAGIAVGGLNKFYDVIDAGSSSNLHRDRYRCCMVANSSASKFIGRIPKRVVARLSKTGTLPTGDITCVLRRGSDDTVAVTFAWTGGPNLDGNTVLTTTNTQYTFENLTSTYVWGQGDRICIEYSGNTVDTANDVNVFRNTDNPFDGTASCAVKFEAGGPPPEGYTVADTSRDYAWEIWDGENVPAP